MFNFDVSVIDLIALIVTGVILPILFYILYDRSEKKGDGRLPRKREPKKPRGEWFGMGSFSKCSGVALVWLLGLLVWGGIVCVILFL